MTELIGGAHQSDTHQKALRINLDPRWYGTIAEIGAGQEVDRRDFLARAELLAACGQTVLISDYFDYR